MTMNESPATYFKKYRRQIGFTSQSSTKSFLSAKDIQPQVDFTYINDLTHRLEDILSKVNNAVHPSCRRTDLEDLILQAIRTPYERIRSVDIISKLNNQGRRPEQVLFSWLRGYAVAAYFTPVISTIFNVDLSSIISIGDDDWRNLDTFKRTPKADMEIQCQGRKLRLEVQCGFQGINDIKEHKFREARKVYEEQSIPTLCIHFDLFNGQTAFVSLNSIADDDLNWVTRQQMEGQSVLAIDQNYFKWRLLDPLPNLDAIEVAW